MCKQNGSSSTTTAAAQEAKATTVTTNAKMEAQNTTDLPPEIQALEKELARRLDNRESIAWEVGKLGKHYPQWVFKTHSKTPIRWFYSDFFEMCSQSHWVVTAVVVIAILCYDWSFVSDDLDVPNRILYFITGLACWPFTEYFMHGTIFHAETSSYWGNTFHFIFHGQHHVCMSDPWRLVMPPHVGYAMGIPFKMLGHYMFGFDKGTCWACGMGIGFVSYDLCHHALHHTSFAFLRHLRIRHFMHHHGHPDKYYGVSHGFTDELFGTVGALKSDVRKAKSVEKKTE